MKMVLRARTEIVAGMLTVTKPTAWPNCAQTPVWTTFKIKFMLKYMFQRDNHMIKF